MKDPFYRWIFCIPCHFIHVILLIYKLFRLISLTFSFVSKTFYVLLPEWFCQVMMTRRIFPSQFFAPQNFLDYRQCFPVQIKYVSFANMNVIKLFFFFFLCTVPLKFSNAHGLYIIRRFEILKKTLHASSPNFQYCMEVVWRRKKTNFRKKGEYCTVCGWKLVWTSRDT